MKKKTTAIVLIVIFTVLTFLDIGLTYFNTPDLAMEANPLIAVWGFGWPTLIIVNIFTLAIFAILAIFSFYKYKTPTIVATDDRDLKFQLEKTSGKGSFFAMLGFSLCYSLIVSRAVVVLEWFTYTISRYDLNIPRGIQEIAISAFRFLKKLPTKRFDLLLAVVVTFVLAVFWLVREERKKKQIAQIKPEEEIYEIQENSDEVKERIAQIMRELDEEENGKTTQ